MWLSNYSWYHIRCLRHASDLKYYFYASIDCLNGEIYVGHFSRHGRGDRVTCFCRKNSYQFIMPRVLRISSDFHESC